LKEEIYDEWAISMKEDKFDAGAIIFSLSWVCRFSMGDKFFPYYHRIQEE